MILFYPDLPRECNKITWILRELGIGYHNDLKKEYDFGFFWSYKTVNAAQHWIFNCYNLGCWDVSKSRVEFVFSWVFHYSSFVTKGPCIEKSEEQASNDPLLMLEPRNLPGKVYQKELRNLVRVPIFKNDIPFVIKKVYEGNDYEAYVLPTEVIFSDTEIELIFKFCKQFGVEFAELDTMRDNQGRLYIIDVNNVAGARLFRKMPDVIPDYVEAFKKAFL